MSDQINESLRAHVTRVGFDLSLAKSHIAALVYIDHMVRQPGDYIMSRIDRRSPHYRAFSWFATGSHGLQDRGLIVYTHPDTIKLPRGVKYAHQLPFRRFYRITPAGKLVIGLLKEAGIYQEYAAALPVSTELRVAG